MKRSTVKLATETLPHMVEPVLKRVRNLEPRRVRLFRFWLHRMLPRHHASFAVASSVFFGVFIGVFPTIGIAIPLTVALCWLFRTPKIPGVVSSFVANPLTQFGFFYPLGYAIGRFLTQPEAISFDFLGEMETLSFANFRVVGTKLFYEAGEHVLAFLVGMTLVSLFFALLFAVAAYMGVEYRKKRHRAKRDALLAKTLREN